MKNLFFTLAVFAASLLNLNSQVNPEISVYLITCGPGKETYSHYGHSALRVINSETKTDVVYNWGVFDFATPNFAWKFAKGRLEYKLDADSFNRFLQVYFYEQRWVKAQKINLEPAEIEQLMVLIAENLKPENKYYRYDFFYDDCSTRIRDLLEKSIGENLKYPPVEKKKKIPSFRQKVGEYQESYPWLDFGIDLIMGSPGNKKASFRDVMFLPIDMMKGLSQTQVNRNGRLIPLLQNPEMVLDFETPADRPGFLSTPIFAFSLLLIAIILLTALVKKRRAARIIDIILFTAFSLLAVLMIFFNFFTDHQQMKWNLNIIWLSPFIFLCLASVALNKEWTIWFRIVFYLCCISFVIQILMPGGYNSAFIPVLFILLVRSSSRSQFSWNPLSIESI